MTKLIRHIVNRLKQVSPLHNAAASVFACGLMFVGLTVGVIGIAGAPAYAQETAPVVITPSGGSTTASAGQTINVNNNTVSTGDSYLPQSGEQTMSLNSNTVSVDDAKLTPYKPYVDETLCKAYKDARWRGWMFQQTRGTEYYNYSVQGAFLASCVNNVIDQIEKLQSAIDAVHTAMGATDPLVAIVTIIARNIMRAVFKKLMNDLVNQICNITNELTQSLDSVFKNAICFPSGKMGALDFTFKLDLPRMKCDGWSIDPRNLLSTTTGNDGADGLASLVGSPVQGIGTDSFNFSTGNGVPPMFRPDMPSGLQLDPDLSMGYSGGTEAIDSTVTCGKGGYQAFLDHLAKSECNGWSCVNQYGYIGRWQMGCGALKDAGYVLSCPNGNDYQNYQWSGKNGVDNYQEFLNSQAAQLNAATVFHDKKWDSISNSAKAQVGKTIQYATYACAQKGANGKCAQCVQTGTKTVTITESGLLAGAHLKGAGGVNTCISTALSGGVCQGYDGNCTGTGVYMARHAGFDISAITGDSCQAK